MLLYCFKTLCKLAYYSNNILSAPIQNKNKSKYFVIFKNNKKIITHLKFAFFYCNMSITKVNFRRYMYETLIFSLLQPLLD